MRRRKYDEIGGFTDLLPHASTDVESSYKVDSRGWRLGEAPGLMALFNKTRPGLFNRIDESHGAMHPPRLDDLPALDRIVGKSVHHCNVCGAQSLSFAELEGRAECPACGSTRRDRSIFRFLAESTLLYRRLPALGVGVPDPLREFWQGQFDGQTTTGAALVEMLRHGRSIGQEGSLELVLLNEVLGDGAESDRILHQAARLLVPGGTLLVAGHRDKEALAEPLAAEGLRFAGAWRYFSATCHFDWLPLLTFRLGPETPSSDAEGLDATGGDAMPEEGRGPRPSSLG
jgi:hypothetical protein